MTSLYKRANGRQRLLMRAIEGAVKNVCDVHPDAEGARRYRRSIAKRATGMLTARWPRVLAAGKAPLPVGERIELGKLSRPPDPNLCKVLERRFRRVVMRGPSWGRLIKHLSRPLTALKAEGKIAEVEARIELLRLIHKLRLEAMGK